MPNWTENELEIYGDEKDIAKFKKQVAVRKGDNKTDLSLDKVYPVPKKLLKDGDWYDWRIDNWGTKWDIDAELVMDEGDVLIYKFESAWSPPVEWLKYASKKYPDLQFKLKYDEPGAGFAGVASAKGGDLQDGCVNY